MTVGAFSAYWDSAIANMKRSYERYLEATTIDWDSPEMVELVRVSRLRKQIRDADTALQARLRESSRDAREAFEADDRARRIARRAAARCPECGADMYGNGCPFCNEYDCEGSE